jgi:hypothetical protein
MRTSQKYKGKGDSARNSSPTVNSGPQTPRTADERLAKEYSEHAQALESEHETLLDLVNEFIVAHEEHPVNVITHLFEFWLLNGGQKLADTHTKTIVSGVLQAIRAIHDIESCVQSIQYFEGEMNECEKGMRDE